MIYPFLDGQYSFVTWAAITCFIEFSESFRENFQSEYHAIILPSLSKILGTDGLDLRIYSAAADCVNLFCISCPKEITEIYLESLTKSLLKCLKTDSCEVQEHCLIAVCGISSSSKEAFSKYYDIFIFSLMDFLQMSLNEEYEKIRRAAMQCIGSIAQAVGKQKFSNDARKIMEFLIIRERDPNITNEERSSIFELFTRISNTMEDWFKPYLDVVIPPLLKSCQLESGCIINEDEQEPDDPDQSIYTIQIRGVGIRKICINTSIIQEKALSCNMIYEFCKNLPKDLFFKYVNETTKIMIPLIRYAYNEDVRHAAVACIPYLIKSTIAGTGKGSSDVRSLLDVIFSPILGSFLTDSVEDQIEILEALNDTIQFYDQPLSKHQHIEILKALTLKINASQDRRALFMSSEHNSLTEEEFDESLNLEVILVGTMVDSILALVKVSRGEFIPVFTQYFYPNILKLLAPDKTPQEKTSAICILDDIVEHAGDVAKPFAEILFPTAIQYATHDNPDLRQCACYGLGVLAQTSGESFRDKVQDVFQLMMKIINAPNSRDEVNGAATDNAISAIGKLLRFQYLNPEILFHWTKLLPTCDDEIEAKIINENFCFFLNNKNVEIYSWSEQ